MDHCYGITTTMNSEELLYYNYNSDDSGNNRTIPIGTVVRLLQSLLVYESAFIDGASLMESILQCVLCWEKSWDSLAIVDGLGERALLLYVKSLSLSSNYIFSAVLDADIYEGNS